MAALARGVAHHLLFREGERDFNHGIGILLPFLRQLEEASTRNPRRKILERRKEIDHESTRNRGLVEVVVGAFDQVDIGVRSFPLDLVPIRDLQNNSSGQSAGWAFS